MKIKFSNILLGIVFATFCAQSAVADALRFRDTDLKFENVTFLVVTEPKALPPQGIEYDIHFQRFNYDAQAWYTIERFEDAEHVINHTHTHALDLTMLTNTYRLARYVLQGIDTPEGPKYVSSLDSVTGSIHVPIPDETLNVTSFICQYDAGWMEYSYRVLGASDVYIELSGDQVNWTQGVPPIQPGPPAEYPSSEPNGSAKEYCQTPNGMIPLYARLVAIVNGVEQYSQIRSVLTKPAGIYAALTSVSRDLVNNQATLTGQYYAYNGRIESSVDGQQWTSHNIYNQSNGPWVIDLDPSNPAQYFKIVITVPANEHLNYTSEEESDILPREQDELIFHTLDMPCENITFYLRVQKVSPVSEKVELQRLNSSSEWDVLDTYTPDGFMDETRTYPLDITLATNTFRLARYGGNGGQPESQWILSGATTPMHVPVPSETLNVTGLVCQYDAGWMEYSYRVRGATNVYIELSGDQINWTQGVPPTQPGPPAEYPSDSPNGSAREYCQIPNGIIPLHARLVAVVNGIEQYSQSTTVLTKPSGIVAELTSVSPDSANNKATLTGQWYSEFGWIESSVDGQQWISHNIYNQMNGPWMVDLNQAKYFKIVVSYPANESMDYRFDEESNILTLPSVIAETYVDDTYIAFRHETVGTPIIQQTDDLISGVWIEGVGAAYYTDPYPTQSWAYCFVSTNEIPLPSTEGKIYYRLADFYEGHTNTGPVYCVLQKNLYANEIDIISYNFEGPASITNMLSDLPVDSSAYKWDAATQGYLSASKGASGWDSNLQVAQGEGFWVGIPGDISGLETGEKHMLMIHGYIAENELSVNIASNFNIIANPYTADLNLSQSELASSGSGSASMGMADAIHSYVVKTNTSGSGAPWYFSYEIYELFDATDYGIPTIEWRPSSDFYSPVTNDIIIPMGEGIWYNSKAGAFNWTPVKPY